MLPLFEVEVLSDVAHHDHSDGKQAELCRAVAMQPVVQPRVDVGEFLDHASTYQ